MAAAVAALEGAAGVEADGEELDEDWVLDEPIAGLAEEIADAEAGADRGVWWAGRWAREPSMGWWPLA